MAVGLGYMFGIRLPQNFNSPYKAADPSDFWRRWHISLSTVLRDYLYIPLGGSRGSEWDTRRNLLCTMLLGGLWHGANWTFVVWGAYHGVLLLGMRDFSRVWSKMALPLQRTVTFALVAVGWVFFRADTLGDALAVLKRLFTATPGGNLQGTPLLTVLICIAAGFAHWGPNTFEMSHDWSQKTALALAGGFAFAVALVLASHEIPFLYFQF